MNERQARQEGYEFTGSYSADKEKMKVRAKRERTEGYLAVVITIPRDPLSRGYGGPGYSVYRKPTEKKIQELAEAARLTEEKKKVDISVVKIWLQLQNGEELFDIIGELFRDGGSGNNEMAALAWARRKKIIV